MKFPFVNFATFLLKTEMSEQRDREGHQSPTAAYYYL